MHLPLVKSHFLTSFLSACLKNETHQQKDRLPDPSNIPPCLHKQPIAPPQQQFHSAVACGMASAASNNTKHITTQPTTCKADTFAPTHVIA